MVFGLIRKQEVVVEPQEPYSGWGQDFSLIACATEMGRDWKEAGVLGAVGAHLLMPIINVAAAAFTALAHGLCLCVKTPAFVINGGLWFIGGFGRYVSIHPELRPVELLSHTYKMVASLTFLALGPITSFVSPGRAYTFAHRIGLAPEEEPIVLKGWEKHRAQMPAGWSPKALAGKAYRVGAFSVEKAREQWDRLFKR